VRLSRHITWNDIDIGTLAEFIFFKFWHDAFEAVFLKLLIKTSPANETSKHRKASEIASS